MIKKSFINRLLDDYNRQRGWGRFFFGNTKGIKQLTKFINSIKGDPERELTNLELKQLITIIDTRWDRLKTRKDSYLTQRGHKKLTNNIYKSLAENISLVQGQSYKRCVLMWDMANTDGRLIDQTPIDAVPLEDLVYVSQNGQRYAFNVNKILNTFSLKKGFINPHTGKLFFENQLTMLRQHKTVGVRFKNFESMQRVIRQYRSDLLLPDVLFRDIQINREGQYYLQKNNLTDLGYQCNENVNLLDAFVLKEDKNQYVFSEKELLNIFKKATLRSGFVNPFSNQKMPDSFLRQLKSSSRTNHSFSTIYKTFLEVSRHDFKSQFPEITFSAIKTNRKGDLYLTHKQLAEIGLIARDNIALADLFVLEQSGKTYALDINQIIDGVTLVSGFRNPITDENLSTLMIEKMCVNKKHCHAVKKLLKKMSLLSSNEMDDDATKQKSTKLKNKHTLLLTPLDTTEPDNLFTSEDGYQFDLRYLLKQFTVKGFINPYTKTSFSDRDISTLSVHAQHGDAFNSLKTKYATLLSMPLIHLLSITATTPLSLVHFTSNNTLIRFYDKDFMQNMIDAYLEKKLSKQDFSEAVVALQNEIDACVEIKKQLSIADDEHAEHLPFYKQLKGMNVLQEKIECSHVKKETFWRFAEKELNGIISKRGDYRYLQGTKHMLQALRAFDSSPSQYVPRDGDNGTIYYRGNTFNEYVARRPENYGKEKGTKSLTNIVNTFKGAFFMAFVLGKTQKVFDMIDGAGTCLGERTRLLGGWLLGQKFTKAAEEYKTVSELFAGYQAEITLAEQSKRFFYENETAVSFILNTKKHDGDVFYYTNALGERTRGVVTGNIVRYYLKTYMCHELLADVAIPDCFKTADDYATKTHSP